MNTTKIYELEQLFVEFSKLGIRKSNCDDTFKCKLKDEYPLLSDNVMNDFDIQLEKFYEDYDLTKRFRCRIIILGPLLREMIEKYPEKMI